MSERTVRGRPAAPGVAIGSVLQWEVAALDARVVVVAREDRDAEVGRASDALEAAVAELEAIAVRLRAGGRAEEADIVETGALMGRDPTLSDTISTAVLRDGATAAAAILAATDAAAASLEALEDDLLSARAADVRSLGARAARIATGGSTRSPLGGAVVLVADDLGPADVIELGNGVRGVVLAAGGVTAHAAIVARSIGIPMVVGAGHEVRDVPDGAAVIVDGTAGCVVVEPAEVRRSDVAAREDERQRARERAASVRDLPAVTTDGRLVRVLANVAGMSELAVALDTGAEGVGLLRTELGFLDAVAWPRAADHRRLLDPLLDRLAGRTATVRILDFGGDKTPPFLDGAGERGIALLRGAPDALEAQLEAILAAGAATNLRILVPMVVEPDDVRWVRDIIDTIVARTAGARRPLLGAMIEVPAAVSVVRSIATEVDLLSIGTNDLAHFHLGVARGSAAAPAHHPAVLRLVDDIVRAAHETGVTVEVCGEAASDPVAMPLLVGLGVDELSVGAARVGEVRWRIRELSHAAAEAAARRALGAESVAQVDEIAASL